MRLLNKIALITGGASGIGLSVAKRFAQEGAKVAVIDVNPTATSISFGNSEARVYKADVSDTSQIANVMEQINHDFNSVPQILVNSAGITRDGFLLSMTPQQFDAVINVNLKGTFIVTQAVARSLKEEGMPGSIINIASIVGKVGNIGQANYAASKSGVIGFTKTVAKEMARYNIRCNAVLPGFIETPMTAVVPEKVMMKMKADIPLQVSNT
eukprot:Colp12_sorted_trinity150504_noHs@20851